MRKMNILTAAASVALLGHGAPAARANTTVVDGALGLMQVRRKQLEANDVRAQQRRTLKAAVRDLTRMGQQQIVLGHIHPRAFREYVRSVMDTGDTVTFEDLDQMRKDWTS